jgi:hypothetical protein
LRESLGLEEGFFLNPHPHKLTQDPSPSTST